MNTGFYVANNNDSYWKATSEQESAINNFNHNHSYRFSGMGSSYWISHSKATIKDVKGLKNKYTFVLTPESGLFIKTSDGKLRHVLEVKKPPPAPV